MWQPDLTSNPRPIYRAIADALGADIQRGALDAGSRLPTQRDLAHDLGLTVTTVTRGYAEAERRGLITSHVGRGTFVRSPTCLPNDLPDESRGIELSVNSMMPREHGAELGQALDGLVSRTGLERLLGYQPFGGAERHRVTGAAWIARRGLDTPVDRVLLTAGGQHAMEVTFATIARRGDLVLTEELTYSGMKALANHLGFRVRGLPMDADGLRPDAFEDACKAGASALYTMPTLQNPTGTIMSEARRLDIAAIAARYDVPIVEDDSYGSYADDDDAPPLASLAAGPSYFISSVSKSIVPGVRIGYLRVPDGMAERVNAAIFASTVMASPLTSELVGVWIDAGLGDRVVAWKRREIAVRQTLARRLLPAELLGGHPSSPHLYLTLPAPWRAPDFVAQARARGVGITAAEEFVVGRAVAPHAVRICLGMPERSALERGLAILAEILIARPEPRGLAV